jgi:hypothetical protein
MKKQVAVLVGAGSIGQAVDASSAVPTSSLMVVARPVTGMVIYKISKRHTKQPPTSVILKNK